MERYKRKKSTSIKPSLIGLLVFGGVDPETGVETCQNAFKNAFSKQKNLEAWKKVGAVPCTRECLQDRKVRHELGKGEEDDPLAPELRNMQEHNNLCVNWLNMHGFRGDQLAAQLQIKEELPEEILMEPSSKERIELLKKASTSGQM